MESKIKYFNGEKGCGCIEYKSNGEIVVFLFESSKAENTINKEIIKINFVQSNKGYIIKEN